MCAPEIPVPGGAIITDSSRSMSTQACEHPYPRWMMGEQVIDAIPKPFLFVHPPNELAFLGGKHSVLKKFKNALAGLAQ